MNHLRFSWLVALVATLGSLYFSEVKHWVPCSLCWYQRILMYPLVILLTVAILKKDQQIRSYIMSMSIIGMCVSMFHYLKQKVTYFSNIELCSSTGVSCNTDYLGWFGFITIPLLAFIAFTLITLTMYLLKRKDKEITN